MRTGDELRHDAKVAVVGALICALVVVSGCLWLKYRPSLQITETPAAAARQSDGSLLLERKPDAKAKPMHAMPNGGKAERKVSVDVQPARADCPICTVDLTLVRMPDDTRRVVASSPTGEVLGGLDVPIVPLKIAKDYPWAIGGSRGTGSEAWGLWVDRDIARIRIGGEVNKTGVSVDGDDRYEARIKLGFRF